MKNIAIVLFGLIALCGCKSTEPKTSDIPVIPVPFGDLSTIEPFANSGYDLSFEFIPLETKNESLCETFNWIAVHNGVIVGHNILKKSIVLFKTNGEFIKKLPIGRGPNELIMPHCISIDEDNDILEVLDYMSREIKRYTLSGDFIDKVSVKLNNLEFQTLGDTRVFFCGNVAQKSQPYHFSIMYPKDGGYNYRCFQPKSGVTTIAYTSAGQITKLNNSAYFVALNNNTIYKLDKGDTIAHKFALVDNMYSDTITKEMKAKDYDDYCKNRCYSKISGLRGYDNGDLWSFEIKTPGNLQGLYWDKVSDKIYRSPFSDISCMFTCLFSDGEYGYHQFSGSIFSRIKKEEFPDYLLPLYDTIANRVAKYGSDENPYIIKVKYTKKDIIQ